MTDTLIVYSTTDGHTRAICERIRQVLEKNGERVMLMSVEEASAVDPNPCDRIVIGASIRYGRHSRKIRDFIQDHAATLEAKPNAFFSVNLAARKPDKNQPSTNPYLRRFLRTIRWQPKMLAVFAGKLDYPRYTPLDRFIIRMIMRLTGGPTDPAAVVDFTDWEQVEAFGQALTKLPRSA